MFVYSDMDKHVIPTLCFAELPPLLHKKSTMCSKMLRKCILHRSIASNCVIDPIEKSLSFSIGKTDKRDWKREGKAMLLLD